MAQLQPTPTVFPWTRYWAPRGQMPTVRDGYLIGPESNVGLFESKQSATLSTLEGLGEVPCLVLLGDVGTGKSFEISGEEQRLRRTEDSSTHATLLLDLKRRNSALIEKEAFSSPEFLGWVEGRHDLTLLFDSMDECWRRITELGPVLLAGFRSHLNNPKGRRLRLRLSCRGAEWQEEIESELCRAFGEHVVGKKVQVWQIAPLTKENVSAAATACGLESQRFLAEVAARDVDALAAHPITLRMLLDIAKAGGTLGRNRAEIYSAGIDLLCRDTHQVQQGVPRLKSTTADRLACVSHVAALCVLTNRYLIFGSAEHRPVDGTGMIAGTDLLGRKAHGPLAPVEFTREFLAETLQTALFDSQPNGILTWRHQSYAEYLAARYLSQRPVPRGQLTQLLCDTSAVRPRIWPQLEETACWLVALVPGLFELLVADNADVFVRCDPARLNAEQRKQIVAGYLEGVRRNEARTPHWSEDNRFGRLRHPGLADQLRAVFEAKCDNWLVKDLALDIARACELREFAPLLIELMFTPGESDHLRHGAGVALRDWADEAIAVLVKERMTPEGLEDDQDNVRGCVLSILWPAHLSVDELVPLLTLPKRDNYTGSYKVFLSNKLAERAAPTDLPALLRWVGTVEPDSDHIDNDPYDGACAKIALAAYRALATPDIRTEFFALVQSLSRRDGRIFSPDGRDLVSETSHRRLFWQEFIAGNEPVRKRIVHSSLHESGLIVRDDFEWAVGQASASASKEARDRWLELAFSSFSPQSDLRDLELLWPLVEADAEVAARVKLYTTEELFEYDEPNWRKGAYYREQEKQAALARRKSLSDRIDEALDLYVGGKTSALWWLIDRLSRPAREPDEAGSNDSEPAWTRLSISQRQRLIDVAPGYLTNTPVLQQEVYDAEHTYHSYQTGARLMIELVVAGSPWLANQPGKFWFDWTPVLFAYQDRARYSEKKPWAALFGIAFRCAREAFLTSLERWLVSRSGRYVETEIFAEVPLSDADVERLFLNAAANASSEKPPDFDLFDHLLKQGSVAAQTTLRSWQPQEKGGAPDRRAAFADALLVCHCPGPGRDEIVARMLADDSWGKTVLGYLGDGRSIRSGWIAELEPETVASLWEWLDRCFPSDPYDRRKGAHDAVTLEHEVYHLRNGLLNCVESSGTEEAVDALGGLVRRHPNSPWLGQILAKARHVCRRREWKPPIVVNVETFLAGLEQRPLCSDGDLCDAVLASIGRYQKKLRCINPTTELWNEPAGLVKTWGPKDENNLADCLARHFNADLKAQGVTAVRESEIRQSNSAAAGDLPDIMVYAGSQSGDGSRLQIVVEVKCAWNVETVSSVQDQLHDRYLRGARCGIHVTGYFTCDAWDDGDRRKKTGFSGKSREELATLLEAEKQQLMQSSQKRIEVIVIDARL